MKNLENMISHIPSDIIAYTLFKLSYLTKLFETNLLIKLFYKLFVYWAKN